MAADSGVLPLSLRVLRALVMVLMVVMIVGVITVVWLLVTRMPTTGPSFFPAELTLLAGTRARAVTIGDGWYGVVTSDDHILIYGKDGTLWQDVPITRPVP